MRLRPAGLADAEALAAAHRAAFGPAAWPAEELSALLTGPGAYALAAEADGAVAGFILCREVAGEAEVLTLAVTPAHRRQGLGRLLLDAAASLAAQAGAEMLFLEVAADNPAAIALYLGAGFTIAGRRSGYYAHGRAEPADALVYRLSLSPRA